jgi:tRNA modification GTPase
VGRENRPSAITGISAETIAAIATPPGIGGVGVVRISGPLSSTIAEALLERVPAPRLATLSPFRDAAGEWLDQGIALFFPAPRSFTGEDVLELQGHGGPVVLDLLLQRCLDLGARFARPGEFSERAFLNGKLDLAQAESLADLIDSGTRTAARLALRTLQGQFSAQVHELAERIVALRAFVEAALDFPDEDIEFLGDERIASDLKQLLKGLEEVFEKARQGQLLRDGMTLVIAGRPNVGKSSLLNALSGRNSAIVTHVPGTTRDLLRESIQIDGMPLHLVDTAGLRRGRDPVEQEGIRRAREEIARADRVLWVFDDLEDPDHDRIDRDSLPRGVPLTLVRNKIDLTGTPHGVREGPQGVEVAIAAAIGLGVDALRDHLKHCIGYAGPEQGEYLARRRHLDALERTRAHVHQGFDALGRGAGAELVAEDLRLAHACLTEITGEYLPDDLLGEIFGRFCIGK